MKGVINHKYDIFPLWRVFVMELAEIIKDARKAARLTQ